MPLEKLRCGLSKSAALDPLKGMALSSLGRKVNRQSENLKPLAGDAAGGA